MSRRWPGEQTCRRHPGRITPTSQEAAPCAQRMPSQSWAQPEDLQFHEVGYLQGVPERAAASTLGSRWRTSTHCPSPSVKVAWELTLSAAGGIGCTVGTQPMVHQQQRIARRAVVTARARHAGPRLPTQQVLTPAWLRSRARSLSSSAARTAWTRPWLLPTSVSGGCGALLRAMLPEPPCSVIVPTALKSSVTHSWVLT